MKLRLQDKYRKCSVTFMNFYLLAFTCNISQQSSVFPSQGICALCCKSALCTGRSSYHHRADQCVYQASPLAAAARSSNVSWLSRGNVAQERKRDKEGKSRGRQGMERVRRRGGGLNLNHRLKVTSQHFFHFHSWYFFLWGVVLGGIAGMLGFSQLWSFVTQGHTLVHTKCRPAAMHGGLTHTHTRHLAVSSRVCLGEKQ